MERSLLIPSLNKLENNMLFNFRVSKALVSSLAVLCAVSAYAIPRGPCENKHEEVCCEEPKPGPFAFAYPMDMNLACPRDFFVHVDGLAFQAKQDGTDFAIIDGNSGANPISNGTVVGFSGDSYDWGYNPGVRAGIGFFLDHDAWSLDFTWTWLNITEYKSASANTSTGIILPTWLLGVDTVPDGDNRRVSAAFKASYDTLDASLGKAYHVSRYLVLNPHFGFRAAWIDEHFSVNYSGTFGGDASGAIHHSDNDMWGIGARAGIDTDWRLGKGWCLFGNLSFAMLFSQFDIDQHLSVDTTINEGFDIDNDFYQNIPNVELAVGLGWGHHFNRDKYHVALRFAYEFQDWFNILNLKKFSSGSATYTNDTVSRGDLTLNGFSLRLQLDI